MLACEHVQADNLDDNPGEPSSLARLLPIVCTLPLWCGHQSVSLTHKFCVSQLHSGCRQTES